VLVCAVRDIIDVGRVGSVAFVFLAQWEWMCVSWYPAHLCADVGHLQPHSLVICLAGACGSERIDANCLNGPPQISRVYITLWLHLGVRAVQIYG
jgi:hypothetical protein